MMPLSPQVPRRGGGISRRVAAALLRLLGWRVAGSVPDVAKCVVVAVPHTSNFDGLYVLPAMLALDLKMSIFGKKSLFAVPGLAAFLCWAGVMPLDRERAGGVVDEAVAAFHRSEQLFLGISPEGTRHAAPKWKSGYWRIARGASVPVLPVAIDYGRREVRFLPLFTPTADMAADHAALAALFRDIEPKHKHRLSLPLRENQT
ncbi:glycerol acyltransferase [Eikenella sp. NML96-A-049]|uniref:1-acyl-sn-glycerol-3-phosphate acyltransferase n=1 Tax=unclassified Eikenella TaxID=2639367 RepID=UPI0007E05497|nr:MULTISPECIES: 1-acyl-sn-glycerol-3-phosphate acyltransferase [unclassified Eikenella]OAM35141.1 glycerol acyltransferase [Eikenella sp. NML070372]OAM40514.1 glycerol acyltransferase [Eikenella sp. NML96-A-049]VDH01269.1 1-acylglycerol-3-phosphate O-acyltransferases [Helicobacter pametensis]